MPKQEIITGQIISSKKLERAKEFRREMTPSERKLWGRLRANRLEGFHFRRQQLIEPYIVDFYCHQAGLVVEVDGSVHLEQVEYDQEREQALQARGLRVIRFTNLDIEQHLEIVLDEILQACQDPNPSLREAP